MGYSEDPTMVRVDFFRQHCNWYTTEDVKWTGAYLAAEASLHEAFRKTLREHLGKRFSEYFEQMTAVCLNPYHELSHPIMLCKGEWADSSGGE